MWITAAVTIHFLSFLLSLGLMITNIIFCRFLACKCVTL